jgi:uncharacterized repeat protein (TIGR03803 family)
MSCTQLIKKSLVLAVLVTLALAESGVGAQAQTFNSLLSFDGTNGAEPYYVYLVQGIDGQLYGTTYTSGPNGYGTVFKITTSGEPTTIYSFCTLPSCADGANPEAGLVLDPNGAFYGTTNSGGNNLAGTIFKITSAGKLTTLYHFCAVAGCADGANPEAELLVASSGILYGTTADGGSNNLGTVFSITAAGKFTVLHSFSGTDGGGPVGGTLVQGANGNLYGTTTYGGLDNCPIGNCGTIFEITPTGKFTSLYSFCAQSGCPDGYNPYAGLVLASDGNFYGTTALGGTSGVGTVFRMTPAGQFTTLYTFVCTNGEGDCPDGQAPNGLIQASDGNLYGTTVLDGGAHGGSAGGTIFQVTTTGALTTLYTFCLNPIQYCTDGLEPLGGLLQDTNGTLYGTTMSGGTTGLDGTVFGLADGLPAFVQTLPTSAKVGAKVTILGTNLKGATSVSFNGTAATFTAKSTEIITTVPSGATTGTVSVTMPSGTLSSNAAFRVVPQILSFNPPSGPVGTAVTITGVSLTAASEVTFGGVATTSFTVDSDTQVTATVPTGAKKGKIAITTPAGTASSATTFTVT